MPNPAPRPSRRWRWLAVLLGAAVALGVADLVLRRTGTGTWKPRAAEYHFRKSPAESFWRMDPERPPEHVWDGDPYDCLPPGAKLTYEVNQQGLRGPLPAAGRATVVVVGDSFTFGEGVSLDDTFVARLGRAFPQGPAFVNAGVPGYGTREEAARLPQLLERFQPKAVLVVFAPNDAIPLPDCFEQEVFILDGRPRSAQPVGLPALLSRILGRSEAEAKVREWQLSYYTGSRREQWGATRAALVAMQKEAAARNAKFGVALFPHLSRIAERPYAPIHDLVAATCKEIGVPYVDLSPALEGFADWELWVHPTDHHPSPRAHAAAAEALQPFVASLLAGAK